MFFYFAEIYFPNLGSDHAPYASCFINARTSECPATTSPFARPSSMLRSVLGGLQELRHQFPLLNTAPLRTYCGITQGHDIVKHNTNAASAAAESAAYHELKSRHMDDK